MALRAKWQFMDRSVNHKIVYKGNNKITELLQNVKNFFVNVWRKTIFDIYVTEYGTALTTILPILFLYLNTVTVTAGTFIGWIKSS
jgi:hypothetical protein